MRTLTPFHFEDQPVRVLLIDAEPWFVLADLCRVLGLSQPNKVALRLADDMKGRNRIPTPGGEQDMAIVSEAGMYEVVIRSDKPDAVTFRRWITSEVLPQIRRTGSYNAAPQLTGKQLLAAGLLEADRVMKEQAATIGAQRAELDLAAPKVLFADAVAASKTSILIGELAKILRGNGVEIGQNRLFTWLRDNGYLIRRGGSDYNSPTQKAMELGLFEIKETAITHSDGHVTISKTSKVTGKGQQYFVERLLGGRGLRVVAS